MVYVQLLYHYVFQLFVYWAPQLNYEVFVLVGLSMLFIFILFLVLNTEPGAPIHGSFCLALLWTAIDINNMIQVKKSKGTEGNYFLVNTYYMSNFVKGYKNSDFQIYFNMYYN